MTRRRPSGAALELAPHWLEIESLDAEAQGVGHRAPSPDQAEGERGKVVFVEGALPSERVQVETIRSKPSYETARPLAWQRVSGLRTVPGCPHFGLHEGACGGCKMQHVDPAAQVAIKQRVLEDNLAHLGKVRAESLLPPIHGPYWGYRYRARLSVRHVRKKGVVLVGFHERKSSYVADMQTCAVLAPEVSDLLLPLRELIGAMPSRERLPQIEVAVGEGAVGQRVLALVLRHLEPLSDDEKAQLRGFAVAHPGVQWWLQPKGPDTVHLLDEAADGTPPLAYRLPEFGITHPFKPTDFTQVNHQINRVLVERALLLLAPLAHERVIDWFCGLGNFTLPIARRAGEVLGIEGSEALVARSRENAAFNQVGNVQFAARNLFELSADDVRGYGHADRWLVDPPREGALALVKALADLAASGGNGERETGFDMPSRIVYVSCNPATLARDAGILVHQAGYVLKQAGVVNMFPHTAHVESIAVFERA
jgi:23S rRNA (uracil1939-C5)-methyltransferase